MRRPSHILRLPRMVYEWAWKGKDPSRSRDRRVEPFPVAVRRRVQTCASTLRAIAECGFPVFRSRLARIVFAETDWQACRRELLALARKQRRELSLEAAKGGELVSDLIRGQKLRVDIERVCHACAQQNLERLRKGIPPECGLEQRPMPQLTTEGEVAE